MGPSGPPWCSRVRRVVRLRTRPVGEWLLGRTAHTPAHGLPPRCTRQSGGAQRVRAVLGPTSHGCEPLAGPRSTALTTADGRLRDVQVTRRRHDSPARLGSVAQAFSRARTACSPASRSIAGWTARRCQDGRLRPRWRAHFVLVRAESDLDDELGAWLQESHDIVLIQSDLGRWSWLAPQHSQYREPVRSGSGYPFELADPCRPVRTRWSEIRHTIFDQIVLMKMKVLRAVAEDMGRLPSRASAEDSAPVVLRTEVVGVHLARYSATTT